MTQSRGLFLICLKDDGEKETLLFFYSLPYVELLVKRNFSMWDFCVVYYFQPRWSSWSGSFLVKNTGNSVSGRWKLHLLPQTMSGTWLLLSEQIAQFLSSQNLSFSKKSTFVIESCSILGWRKFNREYRKDHEIRGKNISKQLCKVRINS